MLSAFTARPIVELRQRDKSKVSSILAHGDQLLAGLSTGSLRIYRVINAEHPPTQDGEAEDAENGEDTPSTPERTELLREYEKFSKYKVEQLAIFKEANIVISLSNALVSIHDLGSFELQEQLIKTRGTSAFAATSNIVSDPSGVPTLVSRLAVVVKRRVLLWSWHDGEVTGEPTEIALPSSIKALSWASGTKIVVALNTNYTMVDIETQDIKQIVGPGAIGGGPEQDAGRLGGVGTGTMSYLGMGGMIPTPLVTGLGIKEMLLAKDVNTHFINREGDAIERRQIPWKTAPEAIGYSYPYLLALQEQNKGVLEVRNPQTLSLLQSISLPGANLLQVPNPNISLAHQGKGFLVASERVIWRMGALDYDSQIDALVEEGHVDEAISLLEMIEETLIRDKPRRLREIKMQKAQTLFDVRKFRDAMDLFADVAAPPERVIKLYPEIISGDLAAGPESPPQSPVRSPMKRGHKKTSSSVSNSTSARSKTDKGETASLKSSKVQPDVLEKDLKPAVRELQGFLADVRRRLQRFFNPDQSVKEISSVQTAFPTEDIISMLQNLLGTTNLDEIDIGNKLTGTARLVDTTLFRAHMYATPSLAGSLFRINNFCDPEVVMTKLEETGRYNDLIDFLYGKKLHRQALERLQKFGQSKDENVDEQLRGPVRTIAYLQNLPPELIDLVLEFAKWPMQVDPNLGMEIFLADTENAESLPRSKVLTFLESVDAALAIKYLEHVIDELNDLTPDLHQKLLTLYFERLKYPSTADRDELSAKFLAFLSSSSQYSAAKIFAILPRDDPTFYEARAIVFSKMGQHKQALEIYVFKLHDPMKAEEYCNSIHLEQALSDNNARRKLAASPMDEQPSIYHVLLNLYLNPPKGEKALWGPAIDIMARHGARLPATSTLEMIPQDLLVKELEFYFRGRIRGASSVMNESKVLAGLTKVQTVRMQAGLLLGEGVPGANGGRGRRVKVDEERVCGVCHKRLGGSVISVFPDNSVVHLGCANTKQQELATARA